MATFKPVQLTKRGDSYIAVYYNHQGLRRRLSLGKDKLQAQRMAMKFNDWLLEGKDPEEEIGKTRATAQYQNITLNDFFPEFMRRHGENQSPKMQLIYQQRFNALSRCEAIVLRPLHTISIPKVSKFMDLRKEKDGVSNATINRDVTVLKTMLGRAVVWGYLEKNPLEKIELLPEAPKRNVIITEEQARDLVAALTPGFRPLAVFAIYTGFRSENILSLTIDQIKFQEDQTAYAMLKVKGGKFQQAWLCSHAIEIAKQAIGTRQTGYVFINPNTGKRFFAVSASYFKAVKRLNLKVGDSYLRFHDLRHVFASWLHKNGVSIDTIRVLLGHSNRSTTDRYVTPDTIGAEQALRLMPKIEKKEPHTPDWHVLTHKTA